MEKQQSASNNWLPVTIVIGIVVLVGFIFTTLTITDKTFILTEQLTNINQNLEELRKLKEKDRQEEIIRQQNTTSQVDEAYDQALEAPEEYSYTTTDEHFTWSIEHTKKPSEGEIGIDDLNGMEVEILSKKMINKRKISLHLKPLSAIARDEVEVTDIFLDVSYPYDEEGVPPQCFDDFSSLAKNSKIILAIKNNDIAEEEAHFNFILKK